jgi:hypothetical protein
MKWSTFTVACMYCSIFACVSCATAAEQAAPSANAKNKSHGGDVLIFHPSTTSARLVFASLRNLQRGEE